METDDLTYDEEYGLKVSLIVNSFKCEYAGCGSHKIKLGIDIDLEELQELFNEIKKVKGIKYKKQ